MKKTAIYIFIIIIAGYVLRDETSDIDIEKSAKNKIDIGKTKKQESFKKTSINKVYINSHMGDRKSNQEVAINKKNFRKISSVEKDLKRLSQMKDKLANDLDIDVEQAIELRGKIIATKEAYGMQLDPLDHFSMEHVSLMELEDIDISSYEELDQVEVTKLIDKYGGITWLKTFYLFRIIRNDDLAPLSNAEIFKNKLQKLEQESLNTEDDGIGDRYEE